MTETLVNTIRDNESRSKHRPRVGFAGLGWIGKSRMEAIVESGAVEIAAITDIDSLAVKTCSKIAPASMCCPDIESMLQEELDAIVVATPTGLHKSHVLAALERGCSVFCQKPLATTTVDTEQIIATAQANDCLLGVDLSYRYVRAVRQIKELIDAGEIGDIFAVDLTFHNAYGPDKKWFYDYEFAGGGCVIDLGIHLVDLALWMLDWPEIGSVTSQIYQNGKRMLAPISEVEDYATANFSTLEGTSVNLACSWNLNAGCDAVIKAHFYGTRGSLMFDNVDGSFFDFVATRCTGTKKQIICKPPDDWFGKAAAVWARQLQQSSKYDSEIENIIKVANVLDRIYER